MMKISPKTLEFLIPSYKRPQSCVRAAKSVAEQVEELKISDRVKVTIIDDCSPNLDITEIIVALSQFSHFVHVSQNQSNQGMSLNIRNMVAASNADFCTILTDDDFIQQGSLKEIIETLNSLEPSDTCEVGSFFVPRYSYLEDGTLSSIVCNPFEKDTEINGGPVNSLKYSNNGFILTGTFFRPKLINFKLWDDLIENSFFPIVYFAESKRC